LFFSFDIYHLIWTQDEFCYAPTPWINSKTHCPKVIFWIEWGLSVESKMVRHTNIA